MRVANSDGQNNSYHEDGLVIKKCELVENAVKFRTFLRALMIEQMQ